MTSFQAKLRLPRQIESAPLADSIVGGLMFRRRRLHGDSRLEVPLLEFTPTIRTVLQSALRTGRLVRGLEAAAETLKREQRGLLKMGRGGQGERISRLLLMTDDGSRHFYRKADRLLAQHAPRLLGCVIGTDGQSLGRLLFGPGKNVRLLLISHKEAVCSFLMALVR